LKKPSRGRTGKRSARRPQNQPGAQAIATTLARAEAGGAHEGLTGAGGAPSIPGDVEDHERDEKPHNRVADLPAESN
jgi:hypothetical protein